MYSGVRGPWTAPTGARTYSFHSKGYRSFFHFVVPLSIAVLTGVEVCISGFYLATACIIPCDGSESPHASHAVDFDWSTT